MMHQIYGRKLNRSANERKRLFKNLARSLILNGEIKTTYAKAKSIAPSIEKLITRAKNNSLTEKRLILKEIADNRAVDKLLNTIAPLFMNRSGGYTRITKLSKRFGDNSELVSLSFTERVVNTDIPEKPKKEMKKETKNEVSKNPKEKERNAKDKNNKAK